MPLALREIFFSFFFCKLHFWRTKQFFPKNNFFRRKRIFSRKRNFCYRNRFCFPSCSCCPMRFSFSKYCCFFFFLL